MVRPVLALARKAALGSIHVPRELDRIVSIGQESGIAGAEEIWGRIIALYRSGVHPGIQVCIRHRGRVVLDRSIGHARIGRSSRGANARGEVLATETPVNLFSAAKAITAVVMYKLEEQGVLDLDRPVADYLPGFERHGKGRITAHQILVHRAGIPHLPKEAFDLDLLGDEAAVERLVLDLRPSGEAGDPPAYHAITGGFVMNTLVRRLTGSGLREVLQREFKEPLGLRWFDFGVSPTDARRVAENAMTGLRLGPLTSTILRRVLGIPWKEAVKLSNDPRFLTRVIPSGNLITTAADVAVFYQCLLDGGEFEGVRVLKRKTVDKLLHVPNEEMEVDRLLRMPMRYGNGFMMGSKTLSLYGWNHPRLFGHVGMSNTFTWADPDRDLVVALITTGKPILGPHLLAFVRLISGIHRQFSPE